MKQLIDSALSHIIAQQRRNGGYDAVHARERGLQTASDSEILKLAETEDRVITLNSSATRAVLNLAEPN